MSWTWKNFNWGPAIFLTTYQVLLVVLLPFYCYYCPPSGSLVAISITLYFITGMSITAGYHRYFSHKAFKTNAFIEFLLIFFGSMAIQGSVLRWSFEHRKHHAFVDTEKDPYNINNGFWYAHFFWIYNKPQPIDSKIVPDLINNKMIAFQHKHYPLCMLLSNALVVAFVGWWLNNYMAAIVIAGWTRIFMLHHSTWFINSLAHTWGSKPFCQEQTAVNNFIIAFLTFGEGYHNFHHTYANDYRNGIRWYHYDPTKWLIWLLHKFGMAHSLKFIDTATIRRKLVKERENLLIKQITTLCYVKREELETIIHTLADRLVLNFNECSRLKEKYYHVKANYAHKEAVEDIQNELRRINSSIKNDLKSWAQISNTILNMKPINV